MVHCHVCKKEPERPQRCSKCKKTIYCSTECQAANWKEHKRSVCVKPALLHQWDRQMKKISGPNFPLGRMYAIEDAAWKERAENPQPVSACDGCFRRFRGFPRDEDEDEDEDGGDAGSVFKHCNRCDWTICEDCSQGDMQGVPFFDRPPGTCRCFTSNFGISYCLTTPSFRDGDGRKRYYGDRHPPMAGSGYSENSFESKSRKCKTCGVIARHLKKEHLKDVAPGIV